MLNNPCGVLDDDVDGSSYVRRKCFSRISDSGWDGNGQAPPEEGSFESYENLCPSGEHL